MTLPPPAATMADPLSAAQAAAVDLRALRGGGVLAHVVDPRRGY